MNALAEAMGMTLPGAAAIPAPYRDRYEMAYLTGKRIVEMVWENLIPSKILTREAFENTIVINSAIGGSTNAPVHVNAIARHIGVPLDNEDWTKIGYDTPLLVNMQPAGEYLGEDYYRAGACRRSLRNCSRRANSSRRSRPTAGRMRRTARASLRSTARSSRAMTSP